MQERARSDRVRGRTHRLIGAACLAAGAAPAAAEALKVSSGLDVVRQTLASGAYWAICEGDSLMQVQVDVADLGAQLFNLGLLPNVTAWQLPMRAGGSGPLRSDWAAGVAPEAGRQIDFIDGYVVDAPTGGAERWSVPTLAGQCFFDGAGALGPAGLMLSITHDPGWTDRGVRGPLWARGLSGGLGVRLVYYSHGAGDNDRDLRLHDGDSSPGALVGTANLTTDARRFRSLDEGDPEAGARGAPLAGHANALFPDALLVRHDLESHRLLVYDAASYGAPGASDPGGSRYTTLLAPVIYRADDDGSGAPAWRPGAQVSVLADASWSSYGFSEGAAPTAAFPKTFTAERLTRLLDVSAMSATNTPLFILHVDLSEWNDGARIGAPGDMDLVETYESIFGNYVSMRDAACAAIGLPQPVYLLLMPQYHRGTTGATIGGGTDAEARARLRVIGRAMRSVAESSPRVGYFSIMAATDETLLDASDAARAWLGANGFGRWTLRGSCCPMDMTRFGSVLDGIRQHPRDPDAALFLGHFLREAIESGP
jgi:hypothetical protein